MNRRKTFEYAEKRMLSLEEAAQYIGQGTYRTRHYMDEIGASRKIGRRVVFDKNVIDRALDQWCSNQ